MSVLDFLKQERSMYWLTRGLVHTTCFVLVWAKLFYAQNIESKHLKWTWRVSFDAQVRVRFGVWES